VPTPVNGGGGGNGQRHTSPIFLPPEFSQLREADRLAQGYDWSETLVGSITSAKKLVSFRPQRVYLAISVQNIAATIIITVSRLPGDTAGGIVLPSAGIGLKLGRATDGPLAQGEWWVQATGGTGAVIVHEIWELDNLGA
jgi:hypothetical protein